MPNYNATTPAAPSGHQNIAWQLDGSTPNNVSAYDPIFTGDSGSGGLSGNVPAPGAGDAAAGKYLSASGSFAAPFALAWSSWTPTVSGSGSMTASSLTVTRAIYFRLGPLVFFDVQLTFTAAGTASSAFYITPPPPACVYASGQSQPALCPPIGSQSFYALINSTQIEIYQQGGGNMTIGTTYTFLVSGVYRCT